MFNLDPDALQSAHVRLLEKPVLDVRRPEALLRTVAGRRAIDARRKHHREAVEHASDGKPGVIDSAVDGDGQPEQRIIAALDYARVMSRWRSLRDSFRPEEVIAFELHMFHDVPHADVVTSLEARGFDARIGTVRMWCHRVLARLREEFAND